MRIIEFTIDSESDKSKVYNKLSIQNFVMNLEGVISNNNVIPPWEILNSLFESGSHVKDTDKSYNWEPFKIEKKEYDELIEELKSTGIIYVQYDDMPSWVKNFSEWKIWLMEKLFNVPAKEYLLLVNNYESIAKAMHIAKEHQDAVLMQNLYNDLVVAGNKLRDFANKYQKKN